MITSRYAAALALLFVALSVRVILLRIRYRAALGDASTPELQRAIRVQGNFAEYVPLALVLLYFFEIRGSSTTLVHVAGAALLIGRFSHALGVSQVKEPKGLRQLGMCLTFTILISLAGSLLL